jgi:type IV secretion system protein VirB6
MVFAQFVGWLDQHLATFVANQTARAAASLAPAAGVLGSLYVMGWGYLQLTGQISEPILDGVRRVFALAVVLGVALHLWLYNEVLVALVVDGPQQLAAALVGTSDTVALVDRIWEQGGTCGDVLWRRGGLFSGDVGFYLAGLFVWVVVGTLCLYATFLIALTKTASAILLAVGPMFVLATLFERTRPLFEAWLNQLFGYALVAVLVALLGNLVLELVSSYAEQTAALGSALATVDVLDLLLVTGVVLLLLRQVMPLAASLSRASALSTHGMFSFAVTRAGQFTAATAVSAAALASADTADEELGPVHHFEERHPRVRAPWQR